MENQEVEHEGQKKGDVGHPEATANKKYVAFEAKKQQTETKATVVARKTI